MRFIILSIFMILISMPVKAIDYDAFGSWPVLHDGRMKTMDSFARSSFYSISGQTELNNTPAIEWLAHSLFDPKSILNKPYIRIDDLDILELPKNEKYFSLNQVMAALNPHQDIILALSSKNPATLSSSQKKLIDVYNAVTTYNQIIQSFSAVLPLKKDDRSFYQGGGIPQQRALIAEGGGSNVFLKIVPDDNPSSPLTSVWQGILNSTISDHFMITLQSMATAWDEENYDAWSNHANTMLVYLKDQSDTSWILDLENIYVTYDPILLSMIFYTIGLVILFFWPWIFPIIMGAGIQLFALTARSLILDRPPTGTIYETFLFGSMIIMIVGLFAHWKWKTNIRFLATCCISAIALLFISRGFIQGDSLNVLVAVLNTNFWLSTHVTCIIIGYAFSIMAAMVAHGALATRHIQFEKLMMPLALCALLFTSVGTLLGGIWADQSWGRFWGWDPKENGALIIVLWLVWILHGRISGHLKPRGFATTLALTNITVAITWFGVNLLGVGLHSYGFMSGLAWGLGIFVTIQITVVVILYYRYPKVSRD